MRVRNWAELQHYRDRNPPWIKLHKRLLDDFEFQSLPVASRALAPMLWLLASEEKDGEFDGRPERLAFRLRQPVDEIREALKPLIVKGFVCDASAALSECYLDATPETETETEVETDSVRKASPTAPSRFDSFWSDYPIKREKKKARDIWRRKKLDSIADTIIDDVRMRKAGDKHWLDGFIPHPTTYLNGERWDDEVTPPGERDNDATIQRVGMFPDD